MIIDATCHACNMGRIRRRHAIQGETAYVQGYNADPIRLPLIAKLNVLIP